MAIFEVGQRREQNMTNTVLPSGGTTSSVGIVVNVGDTLTIQSGGVATGTMIDGAVPGYTPALLSALETVSAGGIAIGTIASGQRAVEIVSGGVISGGSVIGGAAFVSSGGTADTVTFSSNGQEVVYSGGVANATVDDGSSDLISFGGVTNGVVVTGGGLEEVFPGGTASGASVVGSNRSQALLGGAAVATLLSAGGTEDVYLGGVATNLTVGSGGEAIVTSGGTANAVTVLSGGFVLLSAGAVASGGIQFSGLGGRVEIAGDAGGLVGIDGAAPTEAISGFNLSDTIYLDSLPYVSGGSVSLSGSTLTIVEGSETVTLTLAGGATSGFALGSDAAGSTVVTVTSNTAGGASTVFGGSGANTVYGGSAAGTINGGSTPLYFVGGTGPVTVTGGSGNTTMFGSTGNANSLLIGGSGTNLLVAGAGASTLVGGSGNTTEFAKGSGPVELVAGAGGNTIMVGQYGTGAETFFTAAGTTAVMALNAAADTVVGGTGNASVVGGAGPEVYGFLNGLCRRQRGHLWAQGQRRAGLRRLRHLSHLKRGRGERVRRDQAGRWHADYARRVQPQGLLARVGCRGIPRSLAPPPSVDVRPARWQAMRAARQGILCSAPMPLMPPTAVLPAETGGGGATMASIDKLT
jgi:autotransporter passenger strand-loop-strand repeat protein